jgi:2,4-dienoyl-CoA reductase-like NADH-dependent reductase (Old Yellow Enzyme family)/thioredoxin reductase
VKSFKKLCEPGKIGDMEIRNRIVMPPMAVPLCSEEGFAGERIKKYLEARAKGGVGLIITGLMGVHPDYILHGGHFAIYDDKFIPGIYEMINAVHVHGAKIFPMLWHPGRQWSGPSELVAPSAIACRSFMYGDREVPRELTTGEVEEYVELFGDGAKRLQIAGADGVALHATHGYLIHQFLAPFTNARQDKYGGSLEGRARFAVEIIEDIIKKCGPDFPVDIRMGQDFLIPGNTTDEIKALAKMMEDAGAACIGASGGHHEATREKLYGGTTSTMQVPPGWELEDAETIKSAVSIPVFAVGGLGVDLELAERVLEEGKADFIQMGRPLIADPDLPIKVMTGRVDEINWCIRCGECHPHDTDMLTRPGLRCSVNAFVSREADPDWNIMPATKPKKVVVVGGGPGGMEAARMAALRGHDVMLYDKSNKLGGLLNVAMKPPGKGEKGIDLNIRYHSNEVKRLGVKVELGVEVTPELIEKVKPDVVILATGATPVIPKIPGVGGKNVLTVEEALSDKGKKGGKAVVLGGGRNGAEVATYLANAGGKVTIIRRSSLEQLEKDVGRGKPTRLQKEIYPELWGIATDLPRRYRMQLIKTLGMYDVNVIYGAKTEKITDKGVTIEKDGAQHFIEADTVVIALGETPNDKLYGKLFVKVPELYMVGDCIKSRGMMEAISEGAYTALKI